MEPKILKSDVEYKNAVKELELIGDNPNLENDDNLKSRFELFSKLIADYEEQHYPIEIGDPIEIIKIRMLYKGLKQKDLQKYIGSKGTVSDVLNRKRGLSKKMIRELSIALDINQEILNTGYELKSEKVNYPQPSKEIVFRFSTEMKAEVESYKKRVLTRRILFNVCQAI